MAASAAGPIICNIFCQLIHSDNGVAAAARSFCDLNSDWNNYVPHASWTLIFKSFVAVSQRESLIRKKAWPNQTGGMTYCTEEEVSAHCKVNSCTTVEEVQALATIIQYQRYGLVCAGNPRGCVHIQGKYRGRKYTKNTQYKTTRLHQFRSARPI